jgi:hypothetical protein
MELLCSVCEARPSVLVLALGKVLCLSCLADKNPALAAEVLRYLRDFKKVKG